MKTLPSQVTTKPERNLRGMFIVTIAAFLAFSLLPRAWSADEYWTDDAAIPLSAGSGPWSLGGGGWILLNVPTLATTWANGDVAHFAGSAGGTVTLFSDISAAGITFDSTAGAFTISTNNHTLSLTGPGIVNSSGQTQSITNDAGIFGLPAGVTSFSNGSTAGNATITNNGAVPAGSPPVGEVVAQEVLAGVGGTTQFNDTSTAGSARITNNGSAVGGAVGGSTQFNNTSTAGTAVITNNGATASGGGGGSAQFTGTSTAGGATITNNGSAVSGGDGGSTQFTGTSTAGSATITTNNGTGGGLGGQTAFLDASDGGTARAITNGNGRFDISGLTTAGMGIGSIEGSGNYFLGGKTLRVGGNNLSTTVSGVIQDGGASGGTGGSLTKVGTGTLTLTGTNTYTGGTTISAGTLQIGNGGTTGSVIGNVVDNATLAFDRSDILTFGGVISGVGGLQQNGPGTLILTGNNTYTGGTSVAPGSTLQVGAGGTTGSIVGNVADAGTLAFDRSDVFTYGGLISGPGSVAQVGTGTTILTGDNTYTGGTSIAPGSTLQLGNGGSTGSVVGDIIDNGTLVVDRSNALTLAGVISGAGGLQQNGSGTLVLTGDNTYTGATTVNAGSLIVDGVIASPLTTVNPGGLLGGSGVLGGDLVNNGIVSPGDSVGTLTVAHNYTQTAGGTLRINVTPGANSVLAVGGLATLAGAVQVVPLGGFQLHVGDRLTFLTAAGGVSGTFATLLNPFVSGTIVQGQLIYLPTGVLLEGTQGSFVTAACNPNSAAVAHSLDAAVGNPRAAGLITFLDNQPFNQLCRDFELISPDELTAVNNMGIALANVQTANVERRLGDIHAGSTGFNASGFTLNGRTPDVSAGLAGVSGPEGKGGPPVMAPIPENRWGVFVTGLGEFTNIGSTANAAGFDVRTGGVTLGADYRIGSNFAVGLLTGYAHTDVGLANGGNLEADGGKFGLYATAFGNGFYADASVIGGYTAYDSRRGALLGQAHGSTDGGDLDVLVAGGYDWKYGGLTVGPTAGFQYTWVNVGAFTEHGSLAPLHIDDQHADSYRTALGAKAAYDWKVGGVLIKPEVSAAWQHEFGQTQYAVVSSFASGAGTSFGVTGPSIGHDSLLLGAGVSVLWNDRIATYIDYDGEIGRANYESNTVTAGVRVTF
jgi:outer membrane autotransporter protein